MTTTMHEKFELLLEKDPNHDYPDLGGGKIHVRISYNFV